MFRFCFARDIGEPADEPRKLLTTVQLGAKSTCLRLNASPGGLRTVKRHRCDGNLFYHDAVIAIRKFATRDFPKLGWRTHGDLAGDDSSARGGVGSPDTTGVAEHLYSYSWVLCLASAGAAQS